MVKQNRRKCIHWTIKKPLFLWEFFLSVSDNKYGLRFTFLLKGLEPDQEKNNTSALKNILTFGLAGDGANDAGEGGGGGYI